MTFTLATWNINSVRLRKNLVMDLMREEGPDVLCLQECKSPVDKMPTDEFAELGYPHFVANGQKGYNGVAIFSKQPLSKWAVMNLQALITRAISRDSWKMV